MRGKRWASQAQRQPTRAWLVSMIEPSRLRERRISRPKHRELRLLLQLVLSASIAAFEFHANARAVCRAGRRVARSRCAVRMTAKGSARPGMACGDRPVEHGPQSGASPAVGIHPAAGLLRAAASALNPPPPSGRLANRPGRHRAERPKRHPSANRDGQSPRVGSRRPWGQWLLALNPRQP